MFSVLHKWFSPRPTRFHRDQRRARPMLETLEDRSVPSSGPLLFNNGHVFLPMDISDSQVLALLNNTSFQAPSNLVSISNTSGGTFTSNQTVTGQLGVATSSLFSLQEVVDNGTPTALPVNSNGSFSFATSLPTNGSADGAHTVTVQAVDTAGNILGSSTFTFTLTPITPTFNLTAGTDTGTLGDLATADSVVALTGTANANVALALLSGPLEGSQTMIASTTSDANGNFTFSNVNLSSGENFFTVQQTDASGAITQSSHAILLTTSPTLSTAISDVTTTTSSSPTVMNLLDNFSDSDLTNFPVVQYDTSLGTTNVQLFGGTGEAPLTVANFLQYVNAGDYNNTVIDRVVPNFVVQGGSFTSPSLSPVADLTTTPLQNEPNISNTLGTISMAKMPGNPNSATNAFFFNVADNSNDPGDVNNLDNQNGGFAAFGQVTTGTTTAGQSTAGINVVNQIAAIPTTDLQRDVPHDPAAELHAGQHTDRQQLRGGQQRQRGEPDHVSSERAVFHVLDEHQ